jgi:hypothetical protein
MDTQSLPLPRYELKFLSGQPRRPWVGMRIEGRTGEIVTDGYRNPIDAADDILTIAQDEGAPVVMPQWLKENMIAEWQQRGIHLYQKAISREWCGNSYICQGWDMAHAADTEPYRSRARLVAA